MSFINKGERIKIIGNGHCQHLNVTYDHFDDLAYFTCHKPDPENHYGYAIIAEYDPYYCFNPHRYQCPFTELDCITNCDCGCD